MASPVDAALIAAQTYKPRPAATPGAKTRAAVQEQGTGAPAPGRRQAPAVMLSLSAEALDILNGNKPSPARAERNAYEAGRQAFDVEEPKEVEEQEVFEPVTDTSANRREAPFAHLRQEQDARPAAPGSRLDILV